HGPRPARSRGRRPAPRARESLRRLRWRGPDRCPLHRGRCAPSGLDSSDVYLENRLTPIETAARADPVRDLGVPAARTALERGILRTVVRAALPLPLLRDSLLGNRHDSLTLRPARDGAR